MCTNHTSSVHYGHMIISRPNTLALVAFVHACQVRGGWTCVIIHVTFLKFFLMLPQILNNCKNIAMSDCIESD